jgi:hypothetical protein
MQHLDLAKTFVLTSSLLGGCLVQLPGNLDAGTSGSDDGTDEGDPGDGDPGDGDPGDGDPGDGDPGDGDGDPGPIDGDGCQSALDVLLIIDNSGSMGEEQALLATAMIEPLLNPLDLSGLDWRLAVTTTDVGNPWCPPGMTTPEAGAFQFRACNDHPEDFLFNNGQIDVQDVACNSICPYAPGKLHTLPTTTDEDPDPKPRPWMENIGGQSNLPEDINPALAALCIVPQGINGCGFEQPLEAMNRALLRAQTPGNPESGFLRLHAGLLVVVVTDEADCSYNPAQETIFDEEGAKTFWEDPQLSYPTSAVCWNAGTNCIGDPAGYDDCVSANYDENGDPATPEQAVLKPVGGYIQTLLDIEQQKRALDPGADVAVLVISGVGLDGQLHYADVGDTNPNFQESFGIGPGCEAPPPMGSSEWVTAVPPVRLREVGAALSSESLASICAPSMEDSVGSAYQRLFGSCE